MYLNRRVFVMAGSVLFTYVKMLVTYRLNKALDENTQGEIGRLEE